MNHLGKLFFLASTLAFLPGCAAPGCQRAPDATHQVEEQSLELMKARSRLASAQSRIRI